ncbi:hypothetical protein [Roseateles oligotrophus]|uniref:Uncharacterized protein n=1 Tax=Roseateles oligotrophus TaxID=1769250 RepID=A0ABT2YJQ0_9BURK|nr:hypothetical protein [Roseateles oligotrophus]MCV2370227.1 hypothetical protein [Roseateles oligotrophus]
MKINKTIAISATALLLAIAGAAFFYMSKPSRPATIGEHCRAYALAIEAVAEARDNLGQPSWDDLVKQHPVLEKDGKNDRAVTYALAISLGAFNKNASPRQLKMNAFEQCPTTFLCLHRGVDCGK